MTEVLDNPDNDTKASPRHTTILSIHENLLMSQISTVLPMILLPCPILHTPKTWSILIQDISFTPSILMMSLASVDASVEGCVPSSHPFSFIFFTLVLNPYPFSFQDHYIISVLLSHGFQDLLVIANLSIHSLVSEYCMILILLSVDHICTLSSYASLPPPQAFLTLPC